MCVVSFYFVVMQIKGLYDLMIGVGLIVCLCCDVLYIECELVVGEIVCCVCCNNLFVSLCVGVFIWIIVLFFVLLVLMVGVVFFLFLEILCMGFGNEILFFGVVVVFLYGVLMLLIVVLLVIIVGLLVVCVCLLVYMLLFLLCDRLLFCYVVFVFCLFEILCFWFMVEIFVIGIVIVLVKVGGLVMISFGLVFWVFCGLIMVNVVSNVFISVMIIWDVIEDGGFVIDGCEVMVDIFG